MRLNNKNCSPSRRYIKEEMDATHIELRDALLSKHNKVLIQQRTSTLKVSYKHLLYNHLKIN